MHRVDVKSRAMWCSVTRELAPRISDSVVPSTTNAVIGRGVRSSKWVFRTSWPRTGIGAPVADTRRTADKRDFHGVHR